MLIRLTTAQGLIPRETLLDVAASTGRILVDHGAAARVSGRTLADAHRAAPYGLRKDGTPRAKPGPRAGG